MMSLPVFTHAQLSVTGGLTPTELVETLVGGGVTVSGVTMNCAPGAYGKFDATATVLGLDSGIMLTSGSILNAIGPNNSGSITQNNGFPGDFILNSIPGVLGTNDACILEFDVTVTSDTLKFNYIFGSDEYLEFVFQFNDVFAFHISGPGITGLKNLALVPGTATPVSIDNVNDIINPAYYVDNGTGFTPPFSTDPQYIQYDGYTVALEAKTEVIPCETYTLRMSIADDLDFIYDSGVFIEAGSLVSVGVELSQSTSVGFGFDNAIEGCVDGIITFTRDIVSSDSLIVYFDIGGSATNGVDYSLIPDSIIILPGEASTDVNIIPAVDGLAEGNETVTIYLVDPCFGVPYDSVTLEIQDEIELDLALDPDTTICVGDTVQLTVDGGLDYTWEPAATLDADTIFNPLAFPDTSTWYVATTVLGTCVESDSVLVNVSPPPPADAGGDLDLCLGYDIQINASGGITYTWEPPDFLDNPFIADPIANPDDTTTYILTVTDSVGCINRDTMTVFVHPNPVAGSSFSDTLLCPGDMIDLQATGGVFYEWQPDDNLSDAFIADPVLTATEDQLYQVIVTDAFGCSDTTFINILVDEYPVVEAGAQVVIDRGESTVLNGAANASFFWSPDSTLSDPLILNPIASPSLDAWYYLTAVSPGGCTSVDSVRVIVVQPPVVVIPSAFSPNGDGVHDELRPVFIGDVLEMDFKIFNRWGNIVFQSNNPSVNWDGTYEGKAQEIGTYIYIFVGVDRSGEEFTLQGNVTLLR